MIGFLDSLLFEGGPAGYYKPAQYLGGQPPEVYYGPDAPKWQRPRYGPPGWYTKPEYVGKQSNYQYFGPPGGEDGRYSPPAEPPPQQPPQQEGGSWWDRNKKKFLLGAGIVGGVAALGGLAYAGKKFAPGALTGIGNLGNSIKNKWNSFKTNYNNAAAQKNAPKPDNRPEPFVKTVYNTQDTNPQPTAYTQPAASQPQTRSQTQAQAGNMPRGRGLTNDSRWGQRGLLG